MSDSPPAEEKSHDDVLILSSGLSPADAPAERDRVLSAMTLARESGTGLKVDLDGDNLSPCAIQLLVATARSADLHSVKLEPTAVTKSALADLNFT